MPFQIPKIPELSEKASAELPSAQQSVSSGKGSYLNWGLRVFLYIMIGLCGVIGYMWRSDQARTKDQIQQMRVEIQFWKDDSHNWQDKYILLLSDKAQKLDAIQDTTRQLKQQLTK